MTDKATHALNTAWYRGELAVQQKVGVTTSVAPIAKQVLRSQLKEPQSTFFSALPFSIVGSVDRAGETWVTLLSGYPGFLEVPDSRSLSVSVNLDPQDPASHGFGVGHSLGLLGDELSTRRRNRINGRISDRDATGFVIVIVIEQSYGNCPRYIQQREYGFVRDQKIPSSETALQLDKLNEATLALIASVDTLFISSYVDVEGGVMQVDVSHKGGRPGFSKVDERGVITIPDFAGNMYFYTLGNILINPKCGLTYVNFSNGDSSQIAGEGVIDFDSPEVTCFQGAKRRLCINPNQIIYRAGAIPVHWSDDPAGGLPSVRMTGTWIDAGANLKDGNSSLKCSYGHYRVQKHGL